MTSTPNQNRNANRTVDRTRGAATQSVERAAGSGRRENKSFILFGGAIAFILAAGLTAVLMSRGSDSDSGSSELTEVAAVTVTGAALPPAPELPGAPDPAVGMTAPTLAGVSPDGTAQTIAVQPGRRLLIVVVAHWCPHCQREVPRLVEWSESGKIPADLDVKFLSTSVQPTAGNYPPSAWLRDVPFPVMVDDTSNPGLLSLGGMGFPNLHLVGSDGKVIARTSGELELPALEQFAART
jgi:cytochrome c biogenesis protein CcmG, thiol:disulfide interchange protein DsbE